MTTPAYLLAKFVPNLQRMEPRNVGVILWTPAGVAGRFLHERPVGSGQVDGRYVPDWLGPRSAYKQWVAYWRQALSGTALRPAVSGAEVALSSLEFLAALQEANKGNYLLVEGGTLLDPVPAGEVEQACQFLFDTLVADATVAGTGTVREPTMEALWDEVLERTQIKQSHLYRRKYPVAVGRETFTFSDALANGTLMKLFDRVPPTADADAFMRNAHHAAWQFEKVLARGVVEKQNTAALVHMTEEEEEARCGSLEALAEVTQVFNLRRAESIAPLVEQISFAVQEATALHLEQQIELE